MKKETEEKIKSLVIGAIMAFACLYIHDGLVAMEAKKHMLILFYLTFGVFTALIVEYASFAFIGYVLILLANVA